MSILFAGGEDIDFPNGNAPFVATAAGSFRVGYGRCTISPGSTAPAFIRGVTLSGGALTSCWLSAQVYLTNSGDNGPFIGLTSGVTGKGLYVGMKSGANNANLVAANGASYTVLATEATTRFTALVLHKLEMQLINFGASATVNVYLDGSLLFTFSGDVTAGNGLTSLDSVSIGLIRTNWSILASEIIVANEDTRGWPGLVTMAPNALGTTNAWSNTAFTNVNPTTINDANATFTNTTAQDNQYNLIDPPSGVYKVGAVVISARAMSTAGATAANIQMGFKNGAATAVAASHATTTAFATYQDIFAVDPTTSAAWVAADLTNLQLNLRSA
jgi:hypothetical protein